MLCRHRILEHKKMSGRIACQASIFNELTELVGKHGPPPDSVISFCQEAMAQDMGYLNDLFIPELDFSTTPLDDWFDFERWCDVVSPGLLHKICGDSAYSENISPKDFFRSSQSLKTALLSKLSEEEDVVRYSCGFVEIQHNDSSLTLIFTDLESWTFESGDLLVTRDMTEVREDQGFYTPL